MRLQHPLSVVQDPLLKIQIHQVVSKKIQDIMEDSVPVTGPIYEQSSVTASPAPLTPLNPPTSSPAPLTPLTPTPLSPEDSSTSLPEPQTSSSKRVAAASAEDQPKSKKSKTQTAVPGDEDSDDKDVDSEENEQAIKLRDNLTADKPEPFGEPLMFAHSRGALCETVHQYKSNQAAAYRNKSRGPSMYFGFLCDGGVCERDFFGDQVIICTIGGGRTKDLNGQMVMESDHKPDYQLAVAAKNSIKYNQAIIACVGQQNTKFPVKLTHYYNVLGWFHITDVWYDKYEKSCWVFRAEAIDLTTRPSWSAKDSPWVPSTLSAPRAPILKCSSCKKDTKEIYTVGWFCMIPKCTSYYQQAGKEVSRENLQYTDVFLQERTQFLGQVPNEVAPVFPDHLMSGPATQDLNAEIKQGYVCPNCKCCCRRLRWNHFSCENPGCNTEHKIPRKVITVSEANSKQPKSSATKSFFNSGITCIPITLGGYSVDVYDMPNVLGVRQDCHVLHFRSNNKINSQPFGPDELFSALQQDDLNLKRCPVRTGGSVVEMVTNHFTKNYGATYKFFVPQECDSFDAAPDTILRILMRNTWATKVAMDYLGHGYVAPNELLSLGYQNNNSIKYHDDGEKTLGPTVTSLSLGGSAVMKWRRKKISARNSANGRLQAASKTVLQIHLQHGDFMIMNGIQIQRQFEHAVEPIGDLRFASTTRTILCDRIENRAERELATKNGIIPDRAANFTYDGDADLVSGST